MKLGVTSAMLAAMLVASAQAALVTSASFHAAHTSGRCGAAPIMEKAEKVKIDHVAPQPGLTPRDVISSVMQSMHRDNWDTPRAFYGFEIALTFLAPTHPAKIAGAKPAGFSRFLRQPHKIDQTLWQEYRFEGELITLTDDDGTEEAYQMVSMRQSPTSEWMSARWKLVKVDCDYGETVKSQWMVEAVFGNEPDTTEDSELQAAAGSDDDDEFGGLDWNGVLVPTESPRQVVTKVMKALRDMDAPYPFHGACVATRYCSPQNRAAELSPQVFASYLEDPWYALLVEWDEMQDSDDCSEDEGVDPDQPNLADIEVLVRREGEESFSLVSWELSLHNGQWLIDSLNIV